MSVRIAVHFGIMDPFRLLLPQCSCQKNFWISVGLYCLLLTQILTPVVSKKDVKSMSSSLQLQCPPCHQLYCTPKNPKRLSCKGGITTGICNCCPVCAKVEGEQCGGEFDYLGKCDTGLVCEIQSGESIINEVLHPDYGSKEGKIISKAEGLCKRVVHTFQPGVLGDQPPLSSCKPKCTPEFCENNPRAICSAIDATENKQTCQGDCQHTSCRACHYVYETRPCGKCKKDDFRCLKQFGQCMRKQTCSQKTFPCKKSKSKSYPKEAAAFQCSVPECL